jgi:hypothetical protein
MNPRIAEIVGELDLVVPLAGAEVIAYVDAFWQSYPRVATQHHYVAFLATPTGFVRFGLALLKAELSQMGKGTDGGLIDLELDYLLRQDSNLDFRCEQVLRVPMSRVFRASGPRVFDWETARSVSREGWTPLLEELDRLLPTMDAEVLITVPQERFPEIPVFGTQAGLLRFGLEFAKGSVAPVSKKGRNGGQIVSLDLDYLIGPDSEVEFDFERVDALPAAGDRRRSDKIPGLGGLAAVAILVIGLGALFRGCVGMI